MSIRYECNHISGISVSPATLRDIVNTKEKYGCYDCQNTGPNLWVCLEDKCYQVGCSESVHDHSTLHNKDNPSHHIQLNLSTRKLWCYACAEEVFLPSANTPYNNMADNTGRYKGDTPSLTGYMQHMDDEDEAGEEDEDGDEAEREEEAMNESGRRYVNGRRRMGASAPITRRRVTADKQEHAGASSDSSAPSSPSHHHHHHHPNHRQHHHRNHTIHHRTTDSDSDCSPARQPHSLHPQQQHPTTTTTTTTTTTSTSTSTRGGLVGLANIGNTCYMNAALQALSNTRPLTGFFLECQQAVHALSEGRKPGLSRTYQVLMRDMWLGRRTGGYVTPSGILCGIRNVHAMFRGFQQHDTQEFLRNFMDQLHEELKQELVVHAAPHSAIAPSPPPYGKYNATTESKAIPNGSIVTPASSSSGMSSAHAHVYTAHHPANDRPPTSSNCYSSDNDGAAEEDDEDEDEEEEEYETCDSGVSERSSLSDDVTDRLSGRVGTGSVQQQQQQQKRRLSRSGSPGRRMRARKQQNTSGDQQSTSSRPGPAKYRSIISDVFDGKLLSSVQCLTCDRVSSRVETFQDLSLPIPSSRDHLVVIHGRGSAAGAPGAPSIACSPTTGATMVDQATSATSLLPALMSADGWLSWLLAWLRSWFYGPAVSLHDCLAAFFSRDELKGDNMYSCERCNMLRNGIKYSKVLQLPEVLCIHLKRFRHELMYSSKISAAVAFPLRALEMRPYLHERCSSNVTSYHLFAVICHHGTAGGGHYTCYALNNGQWYEFDDQYVTATTADQVAQCQAYVLFYNKCTSAADQVKMAAMSISLTTSATTVTTTTTTSTSVTNPNITSTGPTVADCTTCSVNATATGTRPPREFGEGAGEGEAEGEGGDGREQLPRMCYVSKQWLSRFKTCAEPGPIDNSDFLCRHGNVDPLRERDLEKLATLLPVQVYDYLLDRFGGCPQIPYPPPTCATCTATHHRIAAETDHFLALNEAWKRTNTTTDQQQSQPQLTHYLSTAWFARWQAWVQRRAPEPPGPIEKGGRLVQGQVVVGDDCAEVNDAIWSFFYGIYGGGPEVHIAAVAPSDDMLRQPHYRVNQGRQNQSDTDSDEPALLNNHSEDETIMHHNNGQVACNNNNNNSDGMDVDVESDDGAPQFVIPALRRDAAGTAAAAPSAGVNRRLYGRGEPDQVPAAAAGAGEGGPCNGGVEQNHSSAISDAQSPTVQAMATDSADTPPSDKRHNSENIRYRRRRMRDT